MTRKRKINNPFDFAFGMMYNEYPKELHSCLNVPGIFRKKSNVKVRLKNGIVREMDASYVVDPDFKVLFEPAVVDLEQQSTPVDAEKIIVIGDYNIQQIANEILPTLNVIASHLDEKKSIKEHERTSTYVTRLMFLDLGFENNKKRLSNISDIVSSNKHLTTVDALNLGIIVLFAPRDNACEITRQVIELYMRIDKSKKLEYTLYSVITAMVDAYFDDDNEVEELMNMINSKTDDEIIERFETEIISQNKILELGRELDEANARADAADEEIFQLKTKIRELEDELNSK